MGKSIGLLMICLGGGIVDVGGRKVKFVGGGGVGGNISWSCVMYSLYRGWDGECELHGCEHSGVHIFWQNTC